MISVKIYQPAKTAMSSGQAKIKKWLMVYERTNSQYIEPVMQWTGSTTTLPEVRLFFETKEEAIQFAQSNHWSYRVIEPHQKRIKPKSYSNNFIRPVVE